MDGTVKSASATPVKSLWQLLEFSANTAACAPWLQLIEVTAVTAMEDAFTASGARQAGPLSPEAR
jgi:hypothetical protein